MVTFALLSGGTASDSSWHGHPHLSARLNSPNWVSAGRKVNKHHRVCLAFRFGVQQATTERKTSLCMRCSQAEEHIAFHSGHSAPVQIFLGGNVLMTIIIYSEDVLNFFSGVF